jgi:hypothetical protein
MERVVPDFGQSRSRTGLSAPCDPSRAGLRRGPAPAAPVSEALRAPQPRPAVGARGDRRNAGGRVGPAAEPAAWPVRPAVGGARAWSVPRMPPRRGRSALRSPMAAARVHETQSVVRVPQRPGAAGLAVRSRRLAAPEPGGLGAVCHGPDYRERGPTLCPEIRETDPLHAGTPARDGRSWRCTGQRASADPMAA